MPLSAYLGLAVSGAAILAGLGCIVANPLRKRRDDLPRDDADWDFSVADVERASRLFHTEERF